MGRSEVKNIGRIESVQPRYNLLFRSFDATCCRLAQRNRCGDPLQSLAGGLLTGKHDRKAPPPEGRASSSAPRRALPGTLLHDQDFRNHRRRAQGGRGSGHEPCHAGDALGAVQSGDHRADRGASRPEQLATAWAPPRKARWPGDLKTKLDEITSAGAQSMPTLGLTEVAPTCSSIPSVASAVSTLTLGGGASACCWGQTTVEECVATVQAAVAAA